MQTTPLKNIIGHPYILEFLGNTLSYGQLGHAYLFYGPEGVGKESVARRFAQILLCKKPTNELDACEKCDSCHRFTVDSHPNFQLLEPEGRFNYKVDQLRDLRKNASFTAFQDERRVYLIPDADKMQPEGANAILKTLEEPGSGIILILVTSNLLRMLPTIISRCQQVRFGRLSTSLIEETLVKQYEIDSKIAKLTSVIADGSLGKALSLSNPDIQGMRNQIFTDLSKHSPGDLKNSFDIPKHIIDLRKELDSDKEIKVDIITIYDWLLYWFRDIFVYRITKDENQIINQDFQKEIQAISGKWTWSALRSAIQQLEYLKYISIKNISPQFTLETVLLRAYQTVS